jgi:hypothetical protein
MIQVIQVLEVTGGKAVSGARSCHFRRFTGPYILCVMFQNLFLIILLGSYFLCCGAYILESDTGQGIIS